MPPALPKISEPATSQVLRTRVLVLLAATNGTVTESTTRGLVDSVNEITQGTSPSLVPSMNGEAAAK
jgi:glutamate racemase